MSKIDLYPLLLAIALLGNAATTFVQSLLSHSLSTKVLPRALPSLLRRLWTPVGLSRW